MHDLYLIQHLENKKLDFQKKEDNYFCHKAFIIVVALVLLQHKLIISFFFDWKLAHQMHIEKDLRQ